MSEPHTGRFHEIQDLLDSYIIRETAPTESPTLLQIAGFPHWENVYSNILGFFLDTNQAHGFGSLFIRSILAAYRSNCREDSGVDSAPCPETVVATETVEREVRTSDDKRIDLLVDCSDFRVCIENKIWANLYNDLGHYRDHCEKDSKDRVLGIVLSPGRVTNGELETHRFVSITYEDLVKQVRQLMGSHLGPHNTQYHYLLFDFLEQASRFSRTTNMNDDEQAFLELWKKNDDKISNIEERITKMRERLDAKTKTEAHRQQCLEQLSESARAVFRDWTYQKRVAVFDLAEGGTVDGRKIFLDVEFHPLRVTHTLGNRSHGSSGSVPDALACKIDKCCGTRFHDSPTQSGRFKFAIEESPFDESVCKNAVETSVRILRYIAKRRLPEKT